MARSQVGVSACLPTEYAFIVFAALSMCEVPGSPRRGTINKFSILVLYVLELASAADRHLNDANMFIETNVHRKKRGEKDERLPESVRPWMPLEGVSLVDTTSERCLGAIVVHRRVLAWGFGAQKAFFVAPNAPGALSHFNTGAVNCH